MAVPVSVFNASQQSIAVSVNQGPQFTVPGTGPAQNWAPQTQPAGTGPGYTPGYPGPNVIGNAGQNILQAYVAGTPIGGPFMFALPQHRPVSSVQIYIAFASVQSATLIVLADGALVSQQVQGGALAEGAPE